MVSWRRQYISNIVYTNAQGGHCLRAPAYPYGLRPVCSLHVGQKCHFIWWRFPVFVPLQKIPEKYLADCYFDHPRGTKSGTGQV